MTLAEAAQLLGRTPARVWQYVQQGTLPARRVGPIYVVRREDVLRLQAHPPRRGRPPKVPPAMEGPTVADQPS